MLGEAGYVFSVEPPRLPERPPKPSEHASEYVLGMARAKADEVVLRLCKEGRAESAIVLAADTAVELGDTVLGKPADAAEARKFLQRLSGSRHAVLTGLVLAEADGSARLEAVERTELEMARLSEADIDAYIASGEFSGKAGAYAIQESGDRFIRILSGSRTNVVGLPMECLSKMLAQLAPELAPRGQL